MRPAPDQTLQAALPTAQRAAVDFHQRGSRQLLDDHELFRHLVGTEQPSPASAPPSEARGRHGSGSVVELSAATNVPSYYRAAIDAAI